MITVFSGMWFSVVQFKSDEIWIDNNEVVARGKVVACSISQWKSKTRKHVVGGIDFCIATNAVCNFFPNSTAVSTLLFLGDLQYDSL